MITFTRAGAGVYDPATDTTSGAVTTTITGSAIQVRADPQRYLARELIMSTNPTLLFTPTTYGLHAYTSEFVQPGDTVDWNGVTFTVKDVEPVAPDGIVIIARIVVGA